MYLCNRAGVTLGSFGWVSVGFSCIVTVGVKVGVFRTGKTNFDASDCFLSVLVHLYQGSYTSTCGGHNRVINMRSRDSLA